MSTSLTNTSLTSTPLTSTSSKRPATLKNLVRISRWWAKHQPDARLYTFYENGRRESDHLTYGALDRLSRNIAALLQSQGLEGQRAILIFPPGLDFILAFMGCMYAGVIPVPAYPPEPHRLAHTLGRLHNIIEDAQAAVVLTSEMILGFAEGLMASSENTLDAPLNWLTIEAGKTHPKERWKMPDISPDSMAFLQYTSGSTSSPKGVMIQHGGLVANLEMAEAAYDFQNAEAIFVCWLPLYHDMGLIGNLLFSLFLGGQTHLMPPYTFLKKPFVWLELLSKTGATATAAPNFAFDLAVRKTTIEQRDTLDLSRLRTIVNGAEPIRPDSLLNFNDYFAPAGLKSSALTPSFGLAEVALFVTAGAAGRSPLSIHLDKKRLAQHHATEITPTHPNAVNLVSSGQTWLNSKVVIAQPETKVRLSEGQIGEVWISGPHVAAGYWKRPQLTEDTFNARFAGEHNAGPFLRTGDLGFLKGDDLFVTGRRKDLLIFRGRNLYPQDIESSLDAARALCPELRPGCAAAVSVEIEGSERLVVFQEVDPSRNKAFDAQKTLQILREVIVNAHQIQPHAIILLQRGTLPKTSSGKVMRYTCKKNFIEGLPSKKLKVLAKDIREVQSSTTSLSPSPAPSSSKAPAEPLASKMRVDKMTAWLREYAPLHIYPCLIEAQHCIPPRTIQDLSNHGFFNLHSPTEGESPLTNSDTIRLLQQLAAIDLTLAIFVSTHNAMDLNPVIAYAKTQLRNTLRPPNVRAEETDSIVETDGPNIAESNALHQLMIAGSALGVIKRCAQLMTHYAGERRVEDGWLLDQPSTLQIIQTTVHEATTLEALTLRLCALRDEGAHIPQAITSACKVIGAESAWKSADQLLQLFGSHGHSKTYIASQRLRDARLLRLLGGANETLLSNCGTSLLESPQAILSFISQSLHNPTLSERLQSLLKTLPKTLPKTLIAEAPRKRNRQRRTSRSASASTSSSASTFSLKHLTLPLGKILCDVLSIAALQCSPPVHNPIAESALEVLKRRLEAQIQALGHTPAPTTRALLSLVQSYTDQIADFVQDEANENDPFALPPLKPRRAPRKTPQPKPQKKRSRVSNSSSEAAHPMQPSQKTAKGTESLSRLKTWMVNWIAEETGTDRRILSKKLSHRVNETASLAELGIDSMTAIQFIGALEEKFNRPIPTSALWDHKNLNDFAKYLHQKTNTL